MSDLSGAFAVYDGVVWVVAQASVFSVFGGEEDPDEHLDNWHRAGAVRDDHAHPRESTQKPPSRDKDRLWPTPAASMPNDGEEPAQWLRRWIKVASAKNAKRTGVPLAVAVRAPVVLRVAKIGRIDEARELLHKHEQQPDPEFSSTARLNPRWVELLMGFPEGWTEV